MVSVFHHRKHLLSMLLGGAILCTSSLSSAQGVSFNAPLVDAANRGDETSVLLMLSQGQPVNTQGEYGATPLMRAAYNGHLRIVKVLLGMGADVNAKDIAGATALHIAARQGKQDVVDELLRSRADVNATDQEGWTPLMRATLAKQPGIMRNLLDNGADPFKINSAGEYVLMYAVQTGNKDVVNVLVDKGVVTRDNPAVAPVLGTAAVTAPAETNIAPEPVVSTAPAVPPQQETPQKTEVNPAPVKTAMPEEAIISPKAIPASAAPNTRYFRLQAGIYKTVAEAQEAWDVFAKTYPTLFAKQDNAVMQIPRGQVKNYTLVFGEFSNKQAAQQLCSNLWQKDIGCFVMETPLALAQLQAKDSQEAKTEVAEKAAEPAPAPAPFNVTKALHEEAVQEEIIKKQQALPPLPQGAELVEGLPWIEEKTQEVAAVPDAATIDTQKLLAAGEAASARRQMTIVPQEKPLDIPSKPQLILAKADTKTEAEPSIPVPKVEDSSIKKGKVEVAEAVRVQIGQKIVLPDTTQTPSAANASAAAQAEPVATEKNLLPQINIVGEAESFWIQVGNFPTQDKAVDFAKVIRQNQNFRGIRLRVVRLPEAAAKHEPDIALQLGKFTSESKAKSLCKSDLSYLRCSVIHESGSDS